MRGCGGSQKPPPLPSGNFGLPFRSEGFVYDCFRERFAQQVVTVGIGGSADAVADEQDIEVPHVPGAGTLRGRLRV